MRSAVILPMLVVAALALLPAVASPAQPNRNQATPVVPDPTHIAVYVPPSMLTERAYLGRINLWVEPGKSLADALAETGRLHFPNMTLVPGKEDVAYALLLDLAPKWDVVAGKMRLTLAYNAFAADGRKLFDGSTVQEAPVRGLKFNEAAQSAAMLATQQVLSAVHGRIAGEAANLTSDARTAEIDYALLVNREKPLRTGTAFFINKAGQLLTAAHVARDCMAMDVHADGTTFPVTLGKSSALLDIAVLDSGKPRETAIPLRQGHGIELGESVSSVGYPLSGLLGDSPNLTRGNISASKGLHGSLGMFQFSAPIQPGNSGGPIVSDHGELLGMAVSTLNATRLVEAGHIPQNINFALDGRHVARFLEREGVPFQTLPPPSGTGSMQTANRAALSNTVQLNCYQ